MIRGVNSMNFKKILLYLTPVFILPSVVHAHLIGGYGIGSGLTHPLFGLDHLLAMVAVGVISTQLGGRAIWQVPSTFVGFMILGGALAMMGLGLPAVEVGIALSVLVLGAFIAISRKLPDWLAYACVGLFAVFHGHAHGTEMPSIAQSALYALGFVLSTATLHISGVLIGFYAKRTQIASTVLRAAGAGVAAMGVLFLVGVL